LRENKQFLKTARRRGIQKALFGVEKKGNAL
jgi:hypothetical protein